MTGVARIVLLSMMDEDEMLPTLVSMLTKFDFSGNEIFFLMHNMW